MGMQLCSGVGPLVKSVTQLIVWNFNRHCWVLMLVAGRPKAETCMPQINKAASVLRHCNVCAVLDSAAG